MYFDVIIYTTHMNMYSITHVHVTVHTVHTEMKYVIARIKQVDLVDQGHTVPIDV